MSHRSYKLIGAAGAVALAVGVVAGPAVAAGEYTSNATYTCFSGAIHPPMALAVDTPTSTTLLAGQKLPSGATASVTLGPAATNLMHQQGWDHFTGTIKAPVPNANLGMNMTVPSTPVGPLNGTTVANGTGTVILDYPTAGTKTLQAGDFTATLQGFNASDVAVGAPLPVGCVAPTDGTTVLKDSLSAPLSIIVSKSASKTTASSSYNAKKDIATGVAKVRSTLGLDPSGKVSFLLKRGTHKVALLKASLNKRNVATVHFKGVKRPGKYSITEKYLGNGGLKSSTAKTTFKVS